jgi:hypothetical protein
MLVTIVALFGDDVRLLYFPVSWDDACSSTTFVILVLFGLEWIGNSLFKANYVFKLFFWLDLLATLSLVPDVKWMGDGMFGIEPNIDTIISLCVEPFLMDGSFENDDFLIEGVEISDAAAVGETAQIARAGRAARVGTRAARLIRIVRILRVLRVFKVFKFFGGFAGDEDTDIEQQVRRAVVHSRSRCGFYQSVRLQVRENPSKIGQKLAERTSQRVILVVLSVFVVTTGAACVGCTHPCHRNGAHLNGRCRLRD